jgi:hypothetical protein
MPPTHRDNYVTQGRFLTMNIRVQSHAGTRHAGTMGRDPPSPSPASSPARRQEPVFSADTASKPVKPTTVANADCVVATKAQRGCRASSQQGAEQPPPFTHARSLLGSPLARRICYCWTCAVTGCGSDGGMSPSGSRYRGCMGSGRVPSFDTRRSFEGKEPCAGSTPGWRSSRIT